MMCTTFKNITNGPIRGILKLFFQSFIHMGTVNEKAPTGGALAVILAPWYMISGVPAFGPFPCDT